MRDDQTRPKFVDFVLTRIKEKNLKFVSCRPKLVVVVVGEGGILFQKT